MWIKKKIENIKKACMEKKLGFTLLETLISVLLFSFIAVMMSGVFGTFLKNYIEARIMLQGVDGTQFAMNLMAKTIRTGEVKYTVGSNTLFLYDRAQKKCMEYIYVPASSKMQVDISTTSNEGSVDRCTFASMGGAQDITQSNMITNASFIVVPSTPSSMGIVTLALTVSSPGQRTSPVQVQMTVSLRNNTMY